MAVPHGIAKDAGAVGVRTDDCMRVVGRLARGAADARARRGREVQEAQLADGDEAGAREREQREEEERAHAQAGPLGALAAH